MLNSILLPLSLVCATTAPPLGVPVVPASLVRPHVDQRSMFATTTPPERGATWVDRSTIPMEGAPGPIKEVLAYLPYWELDYDEFQWDKMTTLAYFSANMNSAGDITDDNGWSGPTSQALRQEAASHGVRYILTVTNFSKNSIATLVNSPTHRAHGVDVLLDTVLALDADGVNIDFEGVPVGAKAGLTAFVQETTDAFHAAIPGSQVTVATPAIDWSGAFDYDALAEGSDGLMIMAYGYHWKGGNPGPISPSDSGEIWSKYNLRWTIEDYIQWGKPENKHKFMLGLPFYGRDWVSDGPDFPGDALEDGVYQPFWKCLERAEALGGFVWDEHSKTTYFMDQDTDGTWHQVWCDDGASWLEKLSLVTEYDLQGIGIWALGYERGTTELWDAIAAELIPLPPVEEPPVEEPPVEEPPVDPPVEEPPAEDPPVEDPPAEDPPAEDPVLDDPPGDVEPPANDDSADPIGGAVSGVNNINGGAGAVDAGGCSAAPDSGTPFASGALLLLMALGILGLRRRQSTL